MNNLQSLLLRLLPATATLAAAALLALATVNIVNNYQTNQSAAQSSETARLNQIKIQPPTGALNIKQIPNWHLFGKKDQRAQTKTVPNELIEAPATPLALALQGTFLGKSKMKDSWAIISSSNDKQTMYKVGDAIPGGATLFAVEPFRVILERNGRHESLALPRPSMENKDQASTINNFQPSPRNNASNSLPNTTLPTNHHRNNRYNEKQALIEEMARIRKKFAK